MSTSLDYHAKSPPRLQSFNPNPRPYGSRTAHPSPISQPHTYRHPYRFGAPERTASQPTGPRDSSNSLCYYHRKFSHNALHCMPGSPQFDSFQHERSNADNTASASSQQLNIHTITSSSSISPESYIYAFDTHNNMSFIVDTASPLSILPTRLQFILFPTFQTDTPFCDLYAANGQPLNQSGVLTLSLQFDMSPNQYFVHKFILAEVL